MQYRKSGRTLHFYGLALLPALFQSGDVAATGLWLSKDTIILLWARAQKVTGQKPSMTGCASQRNSKRGANQEFVINRHPALSNKNLGALQAIQEWPSLDRYAIEHSTHHNLYMMYSWKLTSTYGHTKSPTHITKCYDTLSLTA